MKLESMCPSFTEFSDFICLFSPLFLSLDRIAMFILLKHREYERNLKSSSKPVSPPLASDFDVSKVSKFSSTVVNPDEILNSYLRFYGEGIHCSSDVKSYFYEKFSDVCWSRKKFAMLNGFGEGDVLFIARNLMSTIASSLASISDIQKDYASEESNDSDVPLKQGGNKHENKIIVSIELADFELIRRVFNMRLSPNLDLEKDDLSGALCLPLKETRELDNRFLLTSIFDSESSDDASSNYNSSNPDVSDENFSEEADFASQEETDPHGSTITASDFLSKEIASECISYRLEANKENFSEETDFALKEETEQPGSTITASDFCSSGEISSKFVLSHSDVHKDQYSEEADSALKVETDAQKSTLTNDLYSSIEIPNKCILSHCGRQFLISGDSFKIINLIDLAYHLRESEYSKEGTSSSLENSEEVGFYFFDQADFENAKILQNQFLCAKKYAAVNNLVQEEERSENKDSNIQKDSDDFCQTSIFEEAKILLKHEFLECLQKTVEEISTNEERTCSKLQEKLKFQDHIENIHVNENREENSRVKMDHSAVEKSKYYDLDNDLVQKILFSVYDFICEIEENASFCLEKQNLISELQLESEAIHSEPNCVKSVRILLYLLDNIKMDLESKKNEASKLKLSLEDVRELYSYDLNNTKEGRELQETAKKFVADSNKVYAGIEKDIADCEWYYKNLEKILDFYQNKCFISSDCESCDVSSKNISPNSDVYKETFPEEADFPLKGETVPHGNFISASSFCSSEEMLSERILSNSDVRNDQYSEADSHLKEEIEPHGSTISESNFCLIGETPSECNSSRLDVHKDQYSIEADSPLKEETEPQKRTLTNDFYSSIDIPNKCILSNCGRQFLISGESFKIINLIDLAYRLRESECSNEGTSSSFENSEEVCFYFFDQADFENAKLFQNQFLYAKKYVTDNRAAHEELSEIKDFKTQKDYSEDYFQTNVFDEAKNLLKCDFLEYLMETVEEISPDEEGTCSQLLEEPEYKEQHIEKIHFKEENQEDYSNVKMDSSEKIRRYNALDNDLVQKILFSVYDFISEIEGNATFSMEKQNLLESEEVHSEPDCVKSVRILLYLLDNIKMDLESKKDEASKLRLNLEDVRELYSYDLNNTREGRELQETAKEFVAESEKVYAGIEKDIADCAWYYKSLETILNFYENECFLIRSPDL